uniref:WD40 repeat-containing protein SMU1 n=1 Tax=Polytomella parva TaxID=51329 RepID=A0A7S0VM30_9CHLO|mmetsp:Transcript_9281/g.17389  ORF Transcript_9281/g.17389 Transcript_9281/m.17389 type:complete len:534 (+) Transcript_9281:83-1684(+)|eukprot:CAMPEP_0175059310 /NCGR_PEP_ID=MMETSP0052_2-20121109/12361_1 /TAXON_ID=51329 ORGANISM="Polytomella parva, Strain SAG 63-3" /NCGR_SAMPLE_ID=MMETSP0052_2 /ASSEMBLY_ACC=CAM_ASM_000194 /LENGTH=533 /DNA_ID=CAMNT_0016324845 /DNA_START=20 /DNA_END=1621 /DNA_ORIENTATION=+
MSQLEIEATDVIKIILQFCKENGLTESFNTIQNECQVSLNTVDNIETFISNIHNGRWDTVLTQVSQLKLPRSKLEDLYEQIAFEMLELRENDTARSLIRQTPVLQRLKMDNPERYLKLEHLCNRTYFDPKEAYGTGTRDRRRAAVAASLSQEVTTVPPSRLMALIGQALQWQQTQGLLPPGSNLDLFRGAAAVQRDDVDACPEVLDREMTFSARSHPESAAFSPDGTMLVTGSVDGFIEVWDASTGKMRRDLAYQAEETFMLHDDAVLCLGFSSDSEMLVSGSQDGQIRAWRLRSGQCLRKFERAHTSGVTTVQLSKDGSQILSASFDGSIRIHGLRSGRLLKEMRGHGSFVNDVSFFSVDSPDGAPLARVVSAGSDGTVRIWSPRTCECVHAFKPPFSSPNGADVAILRAIPLPGSGQILVAGRSSTAFLMTPQGQVVRSFVSGQKGDGSEFLGLAVSPRAEYAFCLAADGTVCCFSVKSGALEHVIQAHRVKGGAGGGDGGEGNAIGLVQHPLRNLLATFADDGPLRIWKP